MKIKKIGKTTDKKDLEYYVKHRVIPVRFCYPKNGGNRWHRLRQSESYKLGKRELKTFSDGLTKIIDLIGEQINIVHLGPGDGIEIPILFNVFNLNDGRYAGVDISEQMIYNTVRLNKSYFSDINPLWYLTDIEARGNLELVCADVKSKGMNKNLILLTNQGVLLSNLEILKNIHNSMHKQDYLFITIEGDDANKRDEIIATYNLRETRSLLSEGLKKAGYKSCDGTFRTCFNDSKSMVEVYFKPKNESEILCLTSYKPRENEFRRRLKDSGFDIPFLKFYEDIHTFAVLCRKEEK